MRNWTRTTQTFFLTLCATLWPAGGCTSTQDTPLTASSSGSPARRPSDIPLMESLKSGEGLLWMPFSATLSLPRETPDGQPLSVLGVQTVGLVLKDLTRKADVFLKMGAHAPRESSATTLDLRENTVSWYLPRFLALPAGDYEIQSLRLEWMDESGTRKTWDIPYEWQEGVQKPMSLHIASGKISALVRTLARVNISRSPQNAMVLSSRFASLDAGVVPLDVVWHQLQQPQVPPRLLVAASPDVPQTRQSLNPSADGMGLLEAEGPAARTGVLLDLPSDLQGHYVVSLKRTGSNADYTFSIPLQSDAPTQMAPEAQSSATSPDKRIAPEMRLRPASLNLPLGDWRIVATQMIPPATPKLPLDFVEGTAEEEKAARYFDIGIEGHLLGSAAAQVDVKRKIGISLQAPPFSKANAQELKDNLYFLGHFSVSVTRDENTGKAQSWDTFFKPTYALSDLKKQFGAQNIFNAYSLQPLTQDRSRGVINVLLRANFANTSDAKLLDGFTKDVRSRLTDEFSKCIAERTEHDPLLAVNSQLVFSALKNATLINIKGLKMRDGSKDQMWLQECFEKRAALYRFPKALPASFEGELKILTD